MTLTKVNLKKALSVLLAMITLLTLMSIAPFSASAATSGTKSSSSTITVRTKSNYWYPGSSSITLKQSKCKYTYKNTWGKTKTASGYADFKINVYCTNTGKSFTKRLDSSSEKIKLDPNKTYKITVSYDSMGTWLNLNGRTPTWKQTPSWRVSGTWKLSSYY